MSGEIKRLYRSRSEARLVGVCAGLGHYFKIDPVAVRLLWVAATFVTGFVPGILAYLFAWIIVPEEPDIKTATSPTAQANEGGA